MPAQMHRCSHLNSFAFARSIKACDIGSESHKHLECGKSEPQTGFTASQWKKRLGTGRCLNCVKKSPQWQTGIVESSLQAKVCCECNVSKPHTDFSPNQWHHPSVSFPLENQQYYQKYKYFFIENLKKNNIDFIYETTNSDKSIIELIINKKCLSKQRITEILIKFEIVKNCKEFK